MKDLSIVIRISLVGHTNEKPYKFIANEFDITPTPSSSDSGTIYDCSKDVYINTPSRKVCSEFKADRKCIVTITDTNRKEIILGTTNIPSLVSICSYLNRSILKINCKMLRSPF